MDGRAVAGNNLRRRHPDVTLERQLHIRKQPRTLALGWHFHLRRLDDEIGRSPTWMIPALCKLRRSGHVALVPARRARINPRRNLLDFCLTQPPIVMPLARLPFGVPRWHLAGDDLALDRAGPWPHFVVRHERHRRHLAGTMARDAFGVQERSNVLRVRRARRLTENRGRQQGHSDEHADWNMESHHRIRSSQKPRPSTRT